MRSGRGFGHSCVPAFRRRPISTTSSRRIGQTRRVIYSIDATADRMLRTVALLCLLNVLPALGQLTGHVGPTTSSSAKRNTICNVLDYGGSIGSSVPNLLSIPIY